MLILFVLAPLQYYVIVNPIGFDTYMMAYAFDYMHRCHVIARLCEHGHIIYKSPNTRIYVRKYT